MLVPGNAIFNTIEIRNTVILFIRSVSKIFNGRFLCFLFFINISYFFFCNVSINPLKKFFKHKGKPSWYSVNDIGFSSLTLFSCISCHAFHVTIPNAFPKSVAVSEVISYFEFLIFIILTCPNLKAIFIKKRLG